MSLRAWQFEHPRALRDLDIEKLCNFGFIDESWHNDACPKFINEEKHLLVWDDYENVMDREVNAGIRFSVCLYKDCISATDEEVYTTDNYEDLLDALSIFIVTGEWSLKC